MYQFIRSNGILKNYFGNQKKTFVFGTFFEVNPKDEQLSKFDRENIYREAKQ